MPHSTTGILYSYAIVEHITFGSGSYQARRTSNNDPENFLCRRSHAPNTYIAMMQCGILLLSYCDKCCTLLPNAHKKSGRTNGFGCGAHIVLLTTVQPT
jgi:hypothetical protein